MSFLALYIFASLFWRAREMSVKQAPGSCWHDATRSHRGHYHSTDLPQGKMAAVFEDYSFRCVSVNEKFYTLIKVSLMFVPKGPIDNNPALVQIVAWRWPLSQPMIINLLTHICLTQPQWAEHAFLAEFQFKWCQRHFILIMEIPILCKFLNGGLRYQQAWY